MEQFLTQANNKVDAVLAMNDGMATGVAAALAAQKMLGIPLSGQDGDKAALNRIAKGQQTVSVWKKSEPGRHATAEEFKKAVSESPGWVVGRVIEDAELPTDGGRWLYRLMAEGRMENLPVIQSFHLLAGPRGDQVVVTFAMKPEKVKAVGTRDVGLVNAIEFGAEK